MIPTLRELKIDLDNWFLVFLFIKIAFMSSILERMNLILIINTNGRGCSTSNLHIISILLSYVPLACVPLILSNQ